MIKSAAIKSNGKVYSLPKPANHDAIVHYMENKLGLLATGGESGFLDDKGNFLDRKKAFKHALASGQLSKSPRKSDTLHSEDLW